MTYYRNYQDGGKVEPGFIKRWFADKYKASPDQIGGLASQIAMIESDDMNVPQSEGGPGRGYFQFETKKGSGAFQTALQRTKNIYTASGKRIPEWISAAKESDDATTLNREQQEELLLANFAENPRAKREMIMGALESGDAKDLWLQAHWAGKKEQYEEKSKYWDEKFQGMADGGDVRGQSTDTVPAMLTPGEFVIRKDAADKIGPEKLQMLNNIDRLSDTALLENAKSPMGYQKGGLVGMLGNFIKGQKENWARAKTMGEETGVRNPFLRTEEEQLAQMQGAGTVPKGGWLEKKLANLSNTSEAAMGQMMGEGEYNIPPAENPEVSGPSQQKMVEQESEILSNATINGQSATQSQIDAAMEKARQGLAAKKEPYVSALTGGIAPTEEAYAKTTKDIGEREALYSVIPGMKESGYRGTAEGLGKTTVEDYLFATFDEGPSVGRGYRSIEDAVNALMGPESARLKEEAREAGDPSTKAEFFRSIIRGKGPIDARKEAFDELTGGYGEWAVPGMGAPEREGVLSVAKQKELWEQSNPLEQAKRRETETFAAPARHYAVRELLAKLKGAGAAPDWGEYIQNTYGYQNGGEVMNYQNGGQVVKDVLSIFGEKSKSGDEIKSLMAMAAIQQMQRAQQVQQAIGMQGGGYADGYQQGGEVEPPMSGPESGPQEAPLPGGDQTYHQPAMEQLDMDQYEYASYVEHGPDMYKWMAPKYKSKQQWAPYDAMVDAGIIDPYEVEKDEISVVTNDQLEALSNQARESMRV